MLPQIIIVVISVMESNPTLYYIGTLDALGSVVAMHLLSSGVPYCYTFEGTYFLKEP